MKDTNMRHFAALILLVAAETAFAAESDDKPDAEKRLGQLGEMVNYYADSGFSNMSAQYGAFKGYVDRGEGEVLANSLLRQARENAGSTNETQKERFEFAVTWLDEFGGTNALPFLLEEMKREEYKGLYPRRTPNSRHMTVSAFFRIAHRWGATNALHDAAAMLVDEKWSWMRRELYSEARQTVDLYESSARNAVGKKGGGVVNLRPARETICVFMMDCYETETNPAYLSGLDGFLRSKLPEWKTSERRLQGAQRMLRLNPDSKEASGIVRSVQDARAAQPPAGSAPAQPGDASDTEVVEPLPPDWGKFQI